MTPTQQAFLDGIPAPPSSCILEWAERNVKLIGSARSESFDRNTAPWINQWLLDWADELVRKQTDVKPVQSGGSVAGEIAAQYRISFDTGFIQYNWPNDPKADLRWSSRVEKILKACPAIKWPEDKNRIRKRQVDFPRCFFNMQGVWVPDRLDSDSVKFQINEELHDWEPGHLAKAYNRTTAFSWISKIMNISNAGYVGDQLHQAFLSGTQQHWLVRCPGCGQMHEMRTRWEEDKPHLGGLRYDSTLKSQQGDYLYERIKSTLRFQMPCGHCVREDVSERRALSLSGKYSEPRNAGADLSERSYTLEGVAVDWIPWLTLVKEKHEALRALRYGDPAPWDKYLRERECRFFDPADRPLTQRIILNTQAKKNRDGLPDRVLRGMAVDKQRGYAKHGDHPHFRIVIRDFRADASSQLVYEGRVDTPEELERVREEHKVVVGQWPDPSHVLIDSGWDATEVYRICGRYGYTALKGADHTQKFMHEEENEVGDITKIWRIYSAVQMVDPFEGDHEGRAGQMAIPFILYSKQGVMDRLNWLRSRGRSINEEWNDELEKAFGKDDKKFWEVPADVSEDYKRHMEVWDLQPHIIGRTQQTQMLWTKIAEGAPDDSWMCECYLALFAEMAGLIGTGAEK